MCESSVMLLLGISLLSRTLRSQFILRETIDRSKVSMKKRERKPKPK